MLQGMINDANVARSTYGKAMSYVDRFPLAGALGVGAGAGLMRMTKGSAKAMSRAAESRNFKRHVTADW